MKRKKKILNLIMVLLIFVMIGGSVMYAGSLKGWFGKGDDAKTATARCDMGIANIVRSSVGFVISGETPLRDGDEIRTSSMSTLCISADSMEMVLSSESGITVEKAKAGDFSAEFTEGEMFLTLGSEKGFNLTVGGKGIAFSEGVYHISAQPGASSVSVLKGRASYESGSGLYEIEGGEHMSILEGEVEKAKLSAEALNEFTIENAKKSSDICFSAEELDKVIEDREEEKRLALEELSRREAEELAQGGTEETIGPGGQEGDNAKYLSCTIQIRCDTILENMDALSSGKEGYVPQNGIVLSTLKVGFTEGETAFDILSRACSYADIQIEYSWTPIYDSYYVEGINHLYEFDCGPESGWMYKVNGWFPNYGCSSYRIKDGDSIVWCYTCNGLGEDVGGAMN